jgi:nucleoside-diphosphate-sugar epimerase
MTVNAAHFVTGATGFVGSNLVLELLGQPDAHIYALVRPGQEPASVRLRNALMGSARAAGYGRSLNRAVEERCHAVEGNIEEKACGVDALRLPRLTNFWHVAASLRFEDRYADEIYRANVEGTRNALALARRCRLDRYFNYVSTAFVAGCRTGLISEEITRGHETNNHYENSKIQAEMLVNEEHGLPTRIYRPSIVIGHSRTYAVASGFTGLYGFMRRVLRLSQIMRRLQDGLAERTDLQVIIDRGALMNLIPVDVVARQMVRISRSAAGAKVYHITNPAPPSAGEVAGAIFQELDLKLPVFVRDTNRFTWLDRKLDEALGFYRSYFRSNKHFDRRNSDAALGHENEPGYRMDPCTLSSYIRWYAGVLRSSSATVAAAA